MQAELFNCGLLRGLNFFFEPGKQIAAYADDGQYGKIFAAASVVIIIKSPSLGKNQSTHVRNVGLWVL